MIVRLGDVAVEVASVEIDARLDDHDPTPTRADR